jgi:prepilin-type N-terminal cleavage/methylation domain-containing protein
VFLFVFLKKHKIKFMNKKRGFTLIELLVVIAIIGILSSLVLSSLNISRKKGNDAKVKSQFRQLMTASQLYFENNGNYGVSTNSCGSGMFADNSISQLLSGLANGSPSCVSIGSEYAVSIPLLVQSSGANHWCVDSTGHSRAINSVLTAGDAICD